MQHDIKLRPVELWPHAEGAVSGRTMSAGDSSKSVRSEDELGEKWDRCIADSILKTGKLTKLWWVVFWNVIPIGAHQMVIRWTWICADIDCVYY